jgi:hypothetical protein
MGGPSLWGKKRGDVSPELSNIDRVKNFVTKSEQKGIAEEFGSGSG